MLGLGEPDAELVKKHAADLGAAFAVYNDILAKTAYLAGDSVTLADLYHLPYGKMAKGVGFADLFAKYPSVTR
ncbi:hypothetical protein LZ554_003592 [Drepanopeziza brunnea f. sp. 'monogermtubi']|nr:hypothetical protein LZ554_003592 [Drepanopeziza brunnea f. sp. 'monogermtubi']